MPIEQITVLGLSRYNGGTCVFFVRNATGTSLSEAIVIRFALVKGAIS